MNAIKKFLREEDGVTALEYALLAAVIAGVVLVVAGPQLKTLFTTIFGNVANTADNAATATYGGGGGGGGGGGDGG